jgi:hypothetical protein
MMQAHQSARGAAARRSSFFPISLGETGLFSLNRAIPGQGENNFISMAHPTPKPATIGF